jgi:hypothetical protein
MKERILRLCARGKLAIDSRGMEYLQALAGEDEDSAWRRLRSKMSYTGRQLDEIKLLLPSAVPSTGGSPVTIPIPVEPVGGLFGGTPIPAAPAGGQLDPFNAPIGTIFGGVSKPHVSLSNPATSALNLIGKLETWGIGTATPVSEVTIKVSTATGSQLKDLLKRLPDGMTFELTLDKESD